jgi:hypothetical protein
LTPAERNATPWHRLHTAPFWVAVAGCIIIASGYFGGVISLEFLDGRSALALQLTLAGAIAMAGIVALKGIWLPRLHFAWVLAFCAAVAVLNARNADWAYIYLAIHAVAVFAIVATFRRWTQKRMTSAALYWRVGTVTVVFLAFGFLSGYYSFIPVVLESSADQRVIDSVHIGDTFDSVCESVKANGASPLGCIPQAQYKNEASVVLPLLTIENFCVTQGIFSINFVNGRVSKKEPWSITCSTPPAKTMYQSH